MTGSIKKGFLFFLFLLPSLMTCAQGLPMLPKASEINVGNLQNGAETFLIRNLGEAGYADFAIVRQSDSDGSELREALCRLPHFTQGSPFDFITRHGISGGREGYVRADGRYEILRLSNVPVWNKETCDSTLLLLFDVMSLSDAPQAVIVSGDIDVAQIKERSNTLSLMASSLGQKDRDDSYSWKQHDTLRFVTVKTQTRNAAAIRLIYSSRRTSPENMNTILPFVTGMYAEELGNIISKRLRSSFRAAGIPLTGVRFSYKDSSGDNEDERFSLSLVVPFDIIEKALDIAGRVLGSVDRNGVSGEELTAAGNKAVAARFDKPAGMTNAQYVEKCLNSYMSGSNLASYQSINSMISWQGVRTGNELALFNDFASALLDPEKNLVIRIDAPETNFDSERMIASFRGGWMKDVNTEQKTAESHQHKSSVPKVKLTGESDEPITGGRLWTFSNGMKVIVRQRSTPGKFRYALFMNGGYPSVPGIGPGEAGFTADMFVLADKEDLVSKGITLEAFVSMSSFCISGTSPSACLQDVLRALQTMSFGLEVNKEDFSYYVRSEVLDEDSRALFPRNVHNIADSIVCPGYLFYERKDISRLGMDFSERAVDYFHKRLSKMNDGVLVLTGDLQTEDVKKELLRFLGGFGTSKGMLSRPRVSYPMITGKISCVTEASEGLVGGKELGVYLCLSTRQAYDKEEIMAFRMAVQILRRELVGELARCGYVVDVTSKEENYPKSCFTVYADCRPCHEAGLPSDVEIKDQLYVLSVVRKVMERLPGIAVGKDELKAYKMLMKSAFQEEGSDNKSVLKRIEARYCEGKDMVTDVSQTIDGISEEAVRKMLASIVSGAGVEYVIL